MCKGKRKAHPLYRRWIDIKRRCNNPKNTAYHRYGARGISISDAWSSDFWVFVNDIGMPPSAKHTIDRIDNDGPYSKENCRWATRKEQARNRSSCNFIEYKGEVKTLEEWSELYGLFRLTLRKRIAKWGVDNIEKCLTQKKWQR